MRSWRKTHPPTAEEYAKQRCRAYTNVLIKRGHLVRGECIFCGEGPAEAHHPDYTRPRLVVWMCKQHHREHHKEWIST